MTRSIRPERKSFKELWLDFWIHYNEDTIGKGYNADCVGFWYGVVVWSICHMRVAYTTHTATTGYIYHNVFFGIEDACEVFAMHQKRYRFTLFSAI